jgi:cytochrome c nitrite reductase small subunit
MDGYYASWQKGPHHGVAVCNDCHVPHDLAGKYAPA